MLAAIVPAPDATWFFKVVAPADRLGSHKDEVLEFLRTIQVKGAEVRWTAPPSWKEERGAGDRQATLRFGGAEPLLELTVVRLGGAAGGTLPNVNRWRGQMGLGPLAEADLEKETAKVGPAVVVDLVGPRKPAALASAPAPAAPPRGPDDSVDQLRTLFDFQVPAGWVERSAPGPARLFEFQAGQARVSLSYLSGDGGGLEANVNRWRNQAGLDAVGEEQARRLAVAQPFLGREGHYVELVGGERAIVCAFLLGPPYSLFLKMDGSTDAVRKERDAFEVFARTMKIKKHD